MPAFHTRSASGFSPSTKFEYQAGPAPPAAHVRLCDRPEWVSPDSARRSADEDRLGDHALGEEPLQSAQFRSIIRNDVEMAGVQGYEVLMMILSWVEGSIPLNPSGDWL
jgi:hypothetical protein